MKTKIENIIENDSEEFEDDLESFTRKKYKNLPRIAIVGRPNVGKSTLFNRLLRRRYAITDPTPGVTRDPIEVQAKIAGKHVLLIDTGGFKLSKNENQIEDTMDDLVREKTISVLKEADKILLLLDAGLTTPEDEEFIQFLRPYFDKLVVAVNKTEGGRLMAEACSYYAFGFKEIFFISAEHGDNIEDLCEELVRDLDFSRVREYSGDDEIRITLVGKPNTGKSTLANFLTDSANSIISNIPGTTRDIVEGEFIFKNKKFAIQDTAGIRRKAKVHENIEYYSVVRAIKSMNKSDIVFHLIDAQEGLTEQDKKIIVHATSRGLGVIFVLNKWDLMEQTKRAFKDAESNLKIMFGKLQYAPIVAISAQDGTGVKQLLNTAITVFKQLNQKIETSALNLALKDWQQASPPPQGRKNSFSFKYMLQTKTRPVEFLLFANRPDAVTESYLRYIQNSIRKDLGFSLIPILLKIKGSRKRWEERL